VMVGCSVIGGRVTGDESVVAVDGGGGPYLGGGGGGPNVASPL
jgi:hypothetical protein